MLFSAGVTNTCNILLAGKEGDEMKKTLLFMTLFIGIGTVVGCTSRSDKKNCDDNNRTDVSSFKQMGIGLGDYFDKVDFSNFKLLPLQYLREGKADQFTRNIARLQVKGKADNKGDMVTIVYDSNQQIYTIYRLTKLSTLKDFEYLKVQLFRMYGTPDMTAESTLSGYRDDGSTVFFCWGSCWKYEDGKENISGDAIYPASCGKALIVKYQSNTIEYLLEDAVMRDAETRLNWKLADEKKEALKKR